MTNTHVGYGRNIGDGSDLQNQQTTDSLGRYTDESDDFSSKLKIETEDAFSDASGKDAEIKKAINLAFDEGNPSYKGALKALMDKRPFLFVSTSNKGCAYNPLAHKVFLNVYDVQNDGNPYERLATIIEHETSHAIDFSIWNELGSFRNGDIPASGYLKLDRFEGMTMLEIAQSELGDLDDEFQSMINGLAEDPELDSMIEEHRGKMPENPMAPERKLEELAGLPIGTIRNAKDAIDDPFILPSKYIMSVVNVIKDEKALSEIKSLAEERDSWLRKNNELNQRKLKAPFEKAISLQREYGALNDVMSASNKNPDNRGRDFGILGSGHTNGYYQAIGNRATEIFAQIGPILDHCPEAAEWLKKKAPKTIEAYFELLRIATETFNKKGDAF